MDLYLVLDLDEGCQSVNSIWDRETFLKVYKNYLNSYGDDWKRYCDVVQIELNKDGDQSDWKLVYVEDLETNV